LGIYTRRIRGEVFLTETDLSLFAQHHATLALVVAGDRAGFFTCESDGAMQGIRSHQEFPIQELPIPQSVAPSGWWRRTWRAGFSLAGFLGLALSIGACTLLPPAEPPLNLHIRTVAQQLVITWNPAAMAAGTLEIDDGSTRLRLPLRPGQSGVTYPLRASPFEAQDIDVRLSTAPGRGPLRRQAVRMVALQPSASAELTVLRQEAQTSQQRIDELTAKLASITAR
jgi:hypothetical protein